MSEYDCFETFLIWMMNMSCGVWNSIKKNTNLTLKQTFVSGKLVKMNFQCLTTIWLQSIIKTQAKFKELTHPNLLFAIYIYVF